MDEIINNIFDFLKGNIWFNITTLLIAILGIICAVLQIQLRHTLIQKRTK